MGSGKRRFAAIALAGAIAACGGPSDPGGQMPAGYEAFDMTPAVRGDAATIDMDRLAALLPDGFALSWETVEQSGNHTRLTGVELKPDDAAALAFMAGTVEIWGLDPDAIETLKSGNWIETQTRLVERIEAGDLSVSGLEALYAPVLDGMNEAMAPLRELDPDMPDPSLRLEDYAFNVDRFVMAGLDVHPLDKAREGDPGYPGDTDERQLQHAAALAGAFALDGVAFTGLRANMAMTQYGETSQMDFSAGFVGYRGFARGDLASADVKDLSFDMAMQIPPEALGPEVTATGSIALDMS
ncbi:MAG: hypothetical protein GVY06_06010 [Alphaproteobacteria bacterium]|jgi:hypothetical protein|nr:hypothetical protein [Alphaproteobacteria bacterium]